MKGDFTRSTFDAHKRHTGVLQQQGRVQIDADWNELVDIQHYRDRTARTDEVGPCGAPIGNAGFKVELDGDKLAVSPGHYYVDGMLCELDGAEDEHLDLEAQPDLPGYALPDNAGTFAVVLDVFERHLTALEDPSIREVALNGPDHGTRTKLVWQVRAIRIGDYPDAQSMHCLKAKTRQAFTRLVEGSTGTLEVRLKKDDTDLDPCTIPADAGYRGLENLLYRVEVHEGNLRIVDDKPTIVGDTPTFKWSCDNGSIVTEWLDQPSATELRVRSIGRDSVQRFKIGDWVELHDDGRELDRKPGDLFKLTGAEGDLLTVEVPPATSDPDFNSFEPVRKVRKWSSPDGEEDIKSTWSKLENSIEVRFDPSQKYQTGDYWLIPARAATAEIEWPAGEVRLPAGPRHHYCLLGLAKFKQVEGWTVLADCRKLFPPATELLKLSYGGGDGQEAMPGKWLPQPLCVGVSNGQWPVAGARVRFVLAKGGGAITENENDDVAADAGSTVRIVKTDSKGRARVWWRLRKGAMPADAELRVTAELLAEDGKPYHLPIDFSANQSVAKNVAYGAGSCRNLDKLQVKTVQEALDAFCANRALHYVGGDGQSGRPGQVLPVSLRVRVANGSWPVKGAAVRFEVLSLWSHGRPLNVDEAGNLKGLDPLPWGRGRGSIWFDKVVVPTDETGLAQCQWKLGTESRLEAQRVRATLLDGDGKPTDLSVIFTAGILSSDPAVRLLLLDGSSVPLEPGGIIPMSKFYGLQFEELLVDKPDAKPMDWWPGVRVAAEIPQTSTSGGLYGIVHEERILVGWTRPGPDRSLIWEFRRPAETPTPSEPPPEGRTPSEPPTEGRAPSEGPDLRLRPDVGLAREVATARVALETERTDAMNALSLAPEMTPELYSNIRAAVFGWTEAAEEEAAPEPAAPTITPGLAAAPKRGIVYLMRVQLRPWTFPERCAGDAPDFDSYYWLSPVKQG